MPELLLSKVGVINVSHYPEDAAEKGSAEKASQSTGEDEDASGEETLVTDDALVKNLVNEVLKSKPEILDENSACAETFKILHPLK